MIAVRSVTPTLSLEPAPKVLKLSILNSLQSAIRSLLYETKSLAFASLRTTARALK